MSDVRRRAIAQWIQAQDEDILYEPDAVHIDPDVGPMLVAMLARVQTLTQAEARALLGFDLRTTCAAPPLTREESGV